MGRTNFRGGMPPGDCFYGDEKGMLVEEERDPELAYFKQNVYGQVTGFLHSEKEGPGTLNLNNRYVTREYFSARISAVGGATVSIYVARAGAEILFSGGPGCSRLRARRHPHPRLEPGS